MIDEPEFRFRIHRYLIRRDEAGSRKKLFSTIIRDVDKATDFIESGGREGTAVSVFCFVDVKEKRKKAHLKESGEGDEASLGSTLLPDSHSLNGGNVGGWKKKKQKAVDALYASHDCIPFPSLDFSRRSCESSFLRGGRHREHCPSLSIPFPDPQSGAPPKGLRVLAAIYPAQIDS